MAVCQHFANIGQHFFHRFGPSEAGPGSLSGVAACVQNPANPLHGLRLDIGRDVGVGVKRQRNARVAQLLLNAPRTHTRAEHDAGLDGTAVGLGEGTVGVLPQVSHPSRLLSRSGLDARLERTLLSVRDPSSGAQ